MLESQTAPTELKADTAHSQMVQSAEALIDLIAGAISEIETLVDTINDHATELSYLDGLPADVAEGADDLCGLDLTRDLNRRVMALYAALAAADDETDKDAEEDASLTTSLIEQ